MTQRSQVLEACALKLSEIILIYLGLQKVELGMVIKTLWLTNVQICVLDSLPFSPTQPQADSECKYLVWEVK